MSITPLTRVRAEERHPEPATLLPLGIALDDGDMPVDVLDALILTAFATGRQPFARTARLDRVRAEASLRPAGGQVLRSAYDDGQLALIAAGDGWTLHAVRWRAGGARVTVTAVTEELATAVLAEAVAGAEDEPPADDETVVDVGFWHLAAHGPRRSVKGISTSTWPEVRVNYPTAAAAALDALVALRAADVAGRLILLHGPPGTGKTTLLRTLAREWRGWCQLDCVLDPERLFSSPGYLMQVAVGHDEEYEARRWRLLVLEDCDELIRGEAKAAAGQALSRLLNLSDGMLGQGRDVLIAITTNEDLARLHPAVVRPGRCLARIEIGALPYDEAVAWLGDTGGGVGRDGATLAELYALRTGQAPVTATGAEPAPVGGYL